MAQNASILELRAEHKELRLPSEKFYFVSIGPGLLI